MLRILKVGARPSRLAIKQVEEVQGFLPEAELKLVIIETEGDRDKHTPLYLHEGSDFFTRSIEEALIERKIDLAVHSAKDLEKNSPPDLVIAALTKSISYADCLVSRGNLDFYNLPAGARIGTSSVWRKQAILRYRPDFVAKDIRGNVDERLMQLENGDYDAIIVAHAAMIRLGLEDKITQIIPDSIIEPNPLQGRLAIQVLKDREDLIGIFRRLNAS